MASFGPSSRQEHQTYRLADPRWRENTFSISLLQSGVGRGIFSPSAREKVLPVAPPLTYQHGNPANRCMSSATSLALILLGCFFGDLTRKLLDFFSGEFASPRLFSLHHIVQPPTLLAI